MIGWLSLFFFCLVLFSFSFFLFFLSFVSRALGPGRKQKKNGARVPRSSKTLADWPRSLGSATGTADSICLFFFVGNEKNVPAVKDRGSAADWMALGGGEGLRGRKVTSSEGERPMGRGN